MKKYCEEEIVNMLDQAILMDAEDKTALDLNDSTDLLDDLYFDSINIISLIVNIESIFGIQIPDDSLTLEKLRSYKYLKTLLMDLLKTSNGNTEEGETYEPKTQENNM